MISAFSTVGNRLTHAFASLISKRTKLLVLLALAIAALSAFLVVTRRNLDSEVLDLLPPRFESVIGLKEYNNEFSQARQLVIGFLGEPGRAEDVEAFRNQFMSELKRQPWVLRVFDRIPLETDEGLAEIQGIVPSLLLNLPSDQFREALDLLEPAQVQQRLARIRETIGGDSIRAQIDATIDPLGLFAKAMKPLGSSSSIDQGSALASSDNLFQLALIITRQKDLGAPACQAMINNIDQFQAQMLSSWTGYKPKIYVTGRTAFVAQISKSMESDAEKSAVLSILIVSGLFFLAFRRFVPLVGICLILCLSALASLAVGMLIFSNLNMIAIGFFSILVGVGVDFSLLLFGRYQQARRSSLSHDAAVFVSVRDIGAAIFYVVLTTAIGFMALNFSQSPGFGQLGTLVAFGVAFAGLFMVLFLFMFFRGVKPVTNDDFILLGTKSFVKAMFREPRPMLAVSTILLVIGALIAFAPFIPLNFDTNPVSLQPKQIPASIALQVMAEKMNQESDPITILVNAKSQQEFHDRWVKIANALNAAQDRGELKYVSTPVALALSPALIKENRALLRNVNLDQVESLVRDTLEKEGFELDAFKNVFALLDGLKAQQAMKGLPDWSTLFPESSSWWFLIDRYFSTNPTVGVGYTRLPNSIKSEKDQHRIGDLIHQADPGAIVTGWSYTLFDLIPWAQGELVAFTSVVGILILFLLWLVYRRFSLWLVHASALVFSMLALVASLKVLHLTVNLLNTLAFPLVLAIGVDYGIQFLVVSRREGNLEENLANVLKPLSICGLSTLSGFAVLIPTQNPALSGLGVVCATGVFWCLLTTFFYMVPAFAFLQRRSFGAASSVPEVSKNAAAESRPRVSEY